MCHDVGYHRNFPPLMYIPNIYIYPPNVIENPARNDSQIPHQSSPINPHRLINPLTLPPHPSTPTHPILSSSVHNSPLITQTRERDRHPPPLLPFPFPPDISLPIPPYLFITRSSKRRRLEEKRIGAVVAINKNKAREKHASRRRRVQRGNEWEETNGSRVKGDRPL